MFQVTASGIDATDEKARQEGYEARQRDHISHFILRFPYCQSEEYRRWFISRELELFRLRWSHLSAEGKRAFFKFNDLNIPQVIISTTYGRWVEKYLDRNSSVFRISYFR